MKSNNYKLTDSPYEWKSHQYTISLISTRTLLNGLVLSYIRMRYLSIRDRDSLEMAEGARASSRNAHVTSGKFSHVVQAVLFPCPAKKDVVSHPVKAWNKGRHLDLDEPRALAKRCAGKTLWLFPVP